jgi:hypothetical protein
MEIVKVNPAEFGLDEAKANELTVGLKPILDERTLLIERFNEVKDLEITKENIPLFRELRLKFQKNRTQGINKWHEKAKEVPLRMGQLLDAIKRNENATNETHEEYLEKAEKHFENLEKERIAKLKSEREAELQQYCENVSLFPLGEMTAEAYEQLLNGQKLAHAAKVEAERKAAEEKLENERKERVLRERHLELAKYAQFINLAELTLETTQEEFEKLRENAITSQSNYEAEQARIKAENDRLKKEAEAKEATAKKRGDELKPYIVFIRDYNELISADEESYQKQFADIKKGAELQWEEDAKQAKIKAEAEAAEKKRIEDAEKENARLAKELADKKAEDEKAEADRLAKIEADLAMGDADKMKQLAEDIEVLKTKYSFKSKKHNAIYAGVFELLTKVIGYINDKSK